MGSNIASGHVMRLFPKLIKKLDERNLAETGGSSTSRAVNFVFNFLRRAVNFVSNLMPRERIFVSPFDFRSSKAWASRAQHFQAIRHALDSAVRDDKLQNLHNRVLRI